MAINPSDFAVVAISLGDKPGCTEAELRTAVGRLYYSLFHVTFRKLIEIQELGREPVYDVHTKVVKAVRQIKGSLGEQLDRLRMMRTQADYVLSPSDQDYRPQYGDWPKNYRDAKSIAVRIGPSLGSLARKQP